MVLIKSSTYSNLWASSKSEIIELTSGHAVEM